MKIVYLLLGLSSWMIACRLQRNNLQQSQRSWEVKQATSNQQQQQLALQKLAVKQFDGNELILYPKGKFSWLADSGFKGEAYAIAQRVGKSTTAQAWHEQWQQQQSSRDSISEHEQERRLAQRETQKSVLKPPVWLCLLALAGFVFWVWVRGRSG